jgi:hypothetical protein
MCELSDDDAAWKPAPDRFSIAEVLAHLSHSEGLCRSLQMVQFQPLQILRRREMLRSLLIVCPGIRHCRGKRSADALSVTRVSAFLIPWRPKYTLATNKHHASDNVITTRASLKKNLISLCHRRFRRCVLLRLLAVHRHHSERFRA